MLALYKTRFQIEPEEPSTPRHAVAECLQYISSWVEGSYEKSGAEFPGVTLVEDIDRSLETPQLRSAELERGAFFHTFYWRKADSADPVQWVTAIDLVSDGSTLDFQLQLGVEAESLVLEARRPRPARPRLISTLLTHPRWTCRNGNQRLSIHPFNASMYDIEAVCNDGLFSPERELPIVVLTPNHRGRRFPVNPKALAERLGGTARTVQVRDALATQVLDRFLGPSLAIGLDAVRVFGPGAQPGGSLDGHWHFLGETIRAKGLRDREFSDFLFARLSQRALSRFRESPLIPVFRHLAGQERALKLENAREEMRVDKAFFEDYSRELETLNQQLETEKRDLESRVMDRELQMAQLQADLDSARENIVELSRQLGLASVDHAEPPPELGEEVSRTVAEVLQEVAARCPELLLLDSAHRASEAVPVTYKFTDRVVEALEALGEATLERNKKGRMEGGWKPFFESRGFDYKPCLSDTTRNAWGDDYRFLYEGERQIFEEHFTIGVKSANTCISIHFSTKLRDDKIVVAYVGRHLRNTQS